MSNKLIDTLDADQRRALENICAAVARIWSLPLHRYYTDHTVDHSERIITLLDGLTGGMMATDKRLLPTEVYVLLAAAYLHDIGMQNEHFAGGDPSASLGQRLDEIRAHHNEQTAEMIFAVFEDPANAFHIPLAQDPALVEAVALVAKGHRRVDLNGPEYEPFTHGDETLRLRLLAALLRFGDELDIDYRRVDMEQLKLLPLPVESLLHWWRCHYVGGVSIVDGYIRISYRFPRDRPDYENLIVPLVETEVRNKLADLEGIFWANGVKAALGPPQARPLRLVKPLQPEVEALARQCLEKGRAAAAPSLPPAVRSRAPAGRTTAPAEPSTPPSSGTSGTTYNIHIERASSMAIGDGARAVPPTEGMSSQPEREGTGPTARGQRCADLAENIRQTLGLIKQYEDQRRLTDDPKAKRRAEQEIADLREQLAGYEAEYHQLKCE